MTKRVSTAKLKSKVRVKPLYILDDGSISGFYAKGHVDFDDFIESCKTWLDPNTQEDLATPVHTKARLIPNRKEALVSFHLVEPTKSKGAFNCTYVGWKNEPY